MQACFQPASFSFSFLNAPHVFHGEIDWSINSHSRLWKYNLHYFDWLNGQAELGAESGISLMRHWVAANPPGTPDAWDPFPTSLRLVNWLKFFSRHNQHNPPEDLARSIHCQALWLEQRLEFHILANHLFKNIKALLFCSQAFSGPDAQRWRSKGAALLMQELEEQVLADGAHYERSPMYHSMFLEDCLDLHNLCSAHPDAFGEQVLARLRSVLGPLAHFLQALTHPDGQIALFNDAAFGIEAPPGELLAYYSRVTGQAAPACAAAAIRLDQAGYYVLTPGPGDRLIVDCGEIGPEHQPGHSHCDTLSFELSLAGRRIVVDAGCSQYEDGELRRYLRGNAGHNTLTVDDRNQSEVWGAHRCARRARPVSAIFGRSPDGGLVFEGAHDGYRNLKGSPRHTRRIAWTGATCRVEDRVSGSGRHKLELSLHINPDLDVHVADGRAVVMEQGQRIVSISPLGANPMQQAQGSYCPEFGVVRPCTVLRIIREQAELPFSGGWLFEIEGRTGS